MNSKNAFAGGLLIFIGFLFLGMEFNWFHVDWHFISRLWPLLLVYWGANKYFGKSNETTSIITVILLCLALSFTFFHSCKNRVNDKIEWFEHDDEDEEKSFGDIKPEEDNEDRKEIFTSQKIVEEMNPAIKKATFNFEGGAAKFEINGSSNELVEANADLNFGKIALKKVGEGDNPLVNFSLSGKKNNIELDSDNASNKVSVKLNPTVLWNMNFEFGAGKADFDLSPYKVEKLKVTTGVTETDIKLGDKVKDLNVEVESGLTSIEFQVPEKSGCRIKIDGGLNNKHFEEFVKVGDYWETPNYAKASNKINITFSGGLQELSVKRYE